MPGYRSLYTVEIMQSQASFTQKMRNILRFAILTGCLIALAGCFRTHAVQEVSGKLGGKECAAVLTPGAEETLVLYEVTARGRREMWRGIPRSLNPWKIQIADVDGDGEEEIAVGVYKKARFHPVMAKRLFVYGWDGRDAYPKWLGSRLSRPFKDFTFADSGDGTKLIAIEETKDGWNELAVYRWDGFGFTREWTGCRARQLSDLSVRASPGGQTITVKEGPSTRTYAWNGNALELKEADS